MFIFSLTHILRHFLRLQPHQAAATIQVIASVSTPTGTTAMRKDLMADLVQQYLSHPVLRNSREVGTLLVQLNSLLNQLPATLAEGMSYCDVFAPAIATVLYCSHTTDMPQC